MGIKALEKNQELDNEVQFIPEESNINDSSEEIKNLEDNADGEEKATEIEEIEKIKKELKEKRNSYIYIKNISKYYWVEGKRFFNKSEMCENINYSSKVVAYLRQTDIIPTYDDISYFDGEREGVYNLFDKSSLLKPSKTPKLDENIESLINNLCGNNEENIEYLHKAILYKYTHLNDVRVPAVVFYGAGGSGKGTFIKLLSKIFGNENVLSNLSKQDLTSQFSPFRGDKLIVSFDEIVTNNTNEDVNITNKLKNLIFAEKIIVNQKYVNTYPFDNIAWFFISSNNNLPIKLDDKSVGNRRFNVFYSGESLKSSSKIHEAIEDTNIVSNYLAWLFENFKEVPYMTKIEALENEDKRELEFTSQNESNIFWDWLEEKHPEIHGKVEKSTIDRMIVIYLSSNDEIDKKEFIKYFWKNSRYMKKRFRVNGKLTYGALIPKNEELIKVKEDEKNERKLKDEEILKKVGLFGSDIHGINENGKVVEYSVDKGEKELEISFDFASDL